jgi:hypothetical protein
VFYSRVVRERICLKVLPRSLTDGGIIVCEPKPTGHMRSGGGIKRLPFTAVTEQDISLKWHNALGFRFLILL